MKEPLTKNVFKLFTDQVGGDPSEFADILFGRFTVDDFAYSDDMYYWGVVGYFEKTVIPHKIAVYEAGIHLSEQKWFDQYVRGFDKDLFIDNLWLHDLSKFSANEAFGYAMYDFKKQDSPNKMGFEKAWHHHKMNNPHHPEYWMNPNRSGVLEPIQMPVMYIIEMLADWIGAGKTYGSTLEEWLPNNLHKFKFGPNKGMVQQIIRDYGIECWIGEGNILTTENN